MKHLIFPTTAQADAFIADLRSQGLIHPEVGQTSFHRRSDLQSGRGSTGTQTRVVTTEIVDGGGDAGDITGGALKGGVIGTVAGLAAGAVVAASGGLAAIPVILGLGIGAAAGAADGAVHGDGMQDHARGRYEDRYDLDDDHYDRIQSGVGTDGRVVAIEDEVPAEAVEASAARHGGRVV